MVPHHPCICAAAALESVTQQLVVDVAGQVPYEDLELRG